MIDQETMLGIVATEAAEAIASSQQRPCSEAHVWIVHYADERGNAWHHQTISADEVASMAEKAIANGMVSVTILRTQNPVPLNNDSATPVADPKL